MELATVARHLKPWFRRLFKTILFLLISIGVGRIHGPPEYYLNEDFVREVRNLLHGERSIETLYDTYFYIGFVIDASITTVIYLMAMKLIKILRRK